MDKINFKIKEVDNSALIDSLKQDQLIIELFKRKGFSADLLYKYPNKFLRYQQNAAICLKCKGLEQCKQNLKGKYLDIDNEGILIETYRDCKYKQVYDKSIDHLKYYYQCDLPKAHYDVEFKKINLDDEDAGYLKVLWELNNACDNYQSVYLFGSMGSGKSYLAACGCNYHAKKQERVAFVHVPSFSLKIKSLINSNEYEHLVDELKRSKFVVFDDIGAEKVSGWFRDDILLPILNHRMENDLCTWYTSNEDLKSLENHYAIINDDKLKAVRLLERIKTNTKIVELSQKDRRKNCL
ncbi:MAG: ATP-binding protein [Erysipelotrichaceae bacterium]|nr:ATP-binding protein [Erysipelotrichaceae bacterium]MDY5251752.1 ATP-binding protein [Erysipelotrichaceae bacterium]